ncbi:hypothetical protein B1218_33655, partial [Pseudomonas ogarae]
MCGGGGCRVRNGERAWHSQEWAVGRDEELGLENGRTGGGQRCACWGRIQVATGAQGGGRGWGRAVGSGAMQGESETGRGGKRRGAEGGGGGGGQSGGGMEGGGGRRRGGGRAGEGGPGGRRMEGGREEGGGLTAGSKKRRDEKRPGRRDLANVELECVIRGVQGGWGGEPGQVQHAKWRVALFT